MLWQTRRKAACRVAHVLGIFVLVIHVRLVRLWSWGKRVTKYELNSPFLFGRAYEL